MSGGGSAPSAPNLSGNVANANQTFGTATSNAAQTMNTAQAYNTNAMNNLSNVTNTSNSMAQQIGNQANTNMSTYGSTFAPLQQQQANMAQAYGSNENIQQLQGAAEANVNNADQAARQNSAAALAAEGVDPASVQGAALDRQAGVQGAAQVAGAGTQSAINTQLTSNSLVNQANQIGLQVGAQGTQGAATAANVAQGAQQSVNQTDATGVNNLTAANTYLNTGVNANNSGVNASQAQFGDQMQSYNANQAASAGTGQLIGNVAGAALSYMETGGVVPHSGLPVRAGHIAPRSAIPVNFEHMDNGGGVTTNGALPVGTIPGSTDRKPAMLTPGEFVIPKDVVDHLGTEKLHKLVDKTREDANKRRAIPVNHAPHMSMH